MDDLKKLISIMYTLAEEFEKNYSITKTKIKLWDKLLLKEYGIKKIEQAAFRAIKERKYNGFPRIAEIEKMINGSKEDKEEIAYRQFLKAKEAIEHVGAYNSIVFDDEKINRTIYKMGGWINFCCTENDKWVWKEKDFIKIYITLECENGTPKFLLGIFNHATPVKFITQSEKLIENNSNAKLQSCNTKLQSCNKI